VIDGATNAVIATVTAGDAPFILAYNSTNNKVYCANRYSYDITVIDGVTNAVITTIAVGNYPCAFAWNYTQNRTYVANRYCSSISVIRDVIGVEEEKVLNDPRNSLGATILRSPLQLPEGKKCKVFDITGRVVEPTKIQPGIYFIEVDGVVIQKLVKVK
jgi:YVTN family beta-propeller protein